MRLLTGIELEEELAIAVRAGQVRSQLAKVASQAITAIQAEIPKRESAAQQSAAVGMTEFAEALAHLRAATDGLFNVSTIISSMQAARRRSDELKTRLAETLNELQQLNALDLPSELIPHAARDGFATASGKQIGGEVTARNILASAVTGITGQHAAGLLASFTRNRLWALHGQVLASIAAASAPGTDGPTQVKALRVELEAAMRQFRDSAQDSMKVLNRDQVAGIAWATGLWLAVETAEQAILEHIPQMAAAAVVAQDGDEAVARDWAVAYDTGRTLLALVSGGWAVLRHYASFNTDALNRASVAARLRKSPATLDLPRLSIADIAAASEGDLVEVAGVVQTMDVTVGGPTPRSVLTLGPEGGAQVHVLVPFIAVTSFGIQPGVWVQVRGEAYPLGKDGLAGPVVRVARIPRQQASGESFHDWLIWEGRSQFELRPGGWDITAGRQAGTDTTAAELGLRR